MSKSKYSTSLRRISPPSNKSDPKTGKVKSIKNDITDFEASLKLDILPSISPPSYNDDIYIVDKSASNFEKTSTNFRRWMSADSSSEARYLIGINVFVDCKNARMSVI